MEGQSQIKQWVEAAGRGDALAASKLLATFHPSLLARVSTRLESALRGRVEPEDILQQVYLQVIREIDRFDDRGEDSFLHWVTTILDNKLIDARRAAYRQSRNVAREMPAAGDSYWNLLDMIYADAGTPSRAARKDEAVGALLACVSGLSDLHRQVIQLRFLQGPSGRRGGCPSRQDGRGRRRPDQAGPGCPAEVDGPAWRVYQGGGREHISDLKTLPGLGAFAYRRFAASSARSLRSPLTSSTWAATGWPLNLSTR